MDMRSKWYRFKRFFLKPYYRTFYPREINRYTLVEGKEYLLRRTGSWFVSMFLTHPVIVTFKYDFLEVFMFRVADTTFALYPDELRDLEHVDTLDDFERAMLNL